MLGMSIAFNFRNGVFLKRFIVFKMDVAKYKENILIWCFYMLCLYNKHEHTIKAVHEMLTLYFKEHTAITDFNTVASTGFYCVLLLLCYFIHSVGG